MENQEKILNLWAELKDMLDEMEVEFNKNVVKGNVSAGIRLRHGLRLARTVMSRIVKETCEADKRTTAERRATRFDNKEVAPTTAEVVSEQ